MEALEQATAVLAAMPAVIIGDTGVIKNEIQPAMPLMRRQERSIMRDVIYKQMLQDRESGLTLSRNSPMNMKAFRGINVSLHTTFIAVRRSVPKQNLHSKRKDLILL